MAKLIIIADDLTGALEAGVLLRKMYIDAVIISDYRFYVKKPGIKSNRQVLVINSESRHIGSVAAAGRVRLIVGFAQSQGIQAFYKKTDSTMRGNIGAEIDALRKKTGSKRIIYIPAHPILGRFTRNGYQYVGNRKLHVSHFAEDPREPALESFIPAILGRQTRAAIELISPANLEELERPGSRGIQVLDCGSVQDLDMIYHYFSKRRNERAFAGTAAFAGIITRLFPLRHFKPVREIYQHPVLIINGSLNPVSLVQVEYARNTGLTTYSIEGIISGKNPAIAEPNLAGRLIVESSHGKNILLSTSALKKSNYKKRRTTTTASKGDPSIRYASKRLGNFIRPILEKAEFKSIAVFGGDTLYGIIQALKCKEIFPIGEISDGVALSRIRVMNKELFLISKPGGYGNKDAIVRILKLKK